MNQESLVSMSTLSPVSLSLKALFSNLKDRNKSPLESKCFIIMSFVDSALTDSFANLGLNPNMSYLNLP